MSEYCTLTAEEAFAALKSSPTGLSEEEAAERMKRWGKNELRRNKKKGPLRLFLSQFTDFMTILLICAAAISAVTAFITGDVHELVDTGILLFIILLNTFVGFIQQYRADNAIEKLRQMSVGFSKCVRSGRDALIESDRLVPGDVIFLSEGDRVPADCRVLECDRLRCDESSLTGESASVAKFEAPIGAGVPVGDRKNMLHSSTFVVSGQAKALVVGTGANTEIGKIAGMLEETPAVATPLEKILAALGKIITAAVVSVAAVIFIFGFFLKDSTVLGNFMSSVAIAVAAIPEGMPAVVTIIMAMGVQKMSKERAVIRKLHAVETLGGCNKICSDKTGTLTENKMTVEEVCTDFGTDVSSETVTQAMQMTRLCMRACNSVKGSGGALIGDPTEVALVRYAERYESCRYTVLKTEPFTSERKRMSVAVRTEDGEFFWLVKGGADILLSRSDRILAGDRVRTLTERDRQSILSENARMAKSALRVLGFAYKEHEGDGESGLIFTGLCGMIDPPKQGVKEAVAACRRAGIDPVMITGDHRDTAYAIAERLGIATSEEQVLTGAELDAMDETALAENIPKSRVFARVSPKHKSLIVKQLQRAGGVVAMTGDGINDAPSIRAADIGIAMGSGTDVTKNASDMVIADDNFSTIVTAVKEGRRVFSNIKKTIQFFLATNLAEVLSILAVTLVLYRFDFLTATQLLWINLITDSLPVLSLGAERAERDVMLRPPSKAGELFGRRSLGSVLFYGLFQTSVVLFAFLFANAHYGNASAVTITFFVLSFLELFHSFNIRSETTSAFGKGFFSNRVLFVTVLIGVGVNMLLCAVPLFRAAFGLQALSARQWSFVFACSLSVIPAGEIFKFFLRLSEKRHDRSGTVCATGRSARRRFFRLEA